MDGLETIEEVCEGTRGIFDRLLSASGYAAIAGACLYAFILLQQSLDRFAECESVVRGGDGANDGGARDLDGEWHGHYWVEGVTSKGHSFVADITADQFGWPSVVVLPLPCSRDRYTPGNQKRCTEAVAEEIRRMGAREPLIGKQA